MCRIYFIRTEYSSRCDHTDWKFSLFHHSCLYRRCLCTKHDIFINIECILFIFCRMICRNIQFFEIVQIVLYFRSFNYFISHSYEDSFYFFQCDCVWMSMSHTIFLRWKCNIDYFCFQLFLADCFFHLCFCFFHDLLDCSSCLIDKLTNLWTFFWSNILHTFQYSC